MFRNIVLSCFSLLLLCSNKSLAASNEIETVVVTASRTPIDIAHVGSAISLIDGQQLENTQQRQVFDALRELPGVAVSRTGDVGALSEIRIRGGEANHTLVLIDGVEANDPAAASEFNFAHLMSAAVDRVEILRGPQSALWGAQAVSGVVNVVTRAPKPGSSARISAEYGGLNTRYASGVFNAGGPTGGVVLDGAYFGTGGTNIAHAGHENDGYRNITLGGRGEAKMRDVTLSAALHHVSARSETDSADFLGTLAIPTDTGDFTKAHMTYGRAQATADFASDAQGILGLSWTGTDSRNYASPSFPPKFSDVAFNDSSRGSKLKFDGQFNASWNRGSADQHASLLVEHARETFRLRRLDTPSANQNDNRNATAAAVEYRIGWSDRIFGSLGARHDWNAKFRDDTTWRATAAWLLPEASVRLHGSAGTGVKNPTFFEMFGFIPSSFTGNPNLKPEKSLGFDAGVEWHAHNDAALFDVTYYHADLTQEIFTDFSRFPRVSADNMPGRSKRDGVEVAATVRLGEMLQAKGAYTYTDSTSPTGAEELRRPHQIGSLLLDYGIAGSTTHLNVGLDFHGEQRDTEFLNVKPFSRPVILKSYKLLRVAGSYDLGSGLALTGRIENALDQKYEEVFGYRTRGLTATVGLSAQFGE